MSALVRVSALLAALVLLSGARSDALHLTHAEAAARLKAAGITWWSSGNCSDRKRADCTSFEQIRASTVAGVITLKQASACAVMVTGGTETGHGDGVYTHWNGWKVDIQRLDCVSGYIRRFHDVGYIAGWGHQYEAPSGNLYTDEGDHWDILYYTCGGCSPTSPAPSVSPSPSPIPSPRPSPSSSPSPSPAPAEGPAGSRIRQGGPPGGLTDLRLTALLAARACAPRRATVSESRGPWTQSS
jgi:hypothetical protein